MLDGGCFINPWHSLYLWYPWLGGVLFPPETPSPGGPDDGVWWGWRDLEGGGWSWGRLALAPGRTPGGTGGPPVLPVRNANGVIFFPMENPFLTHLSEHPYRRTGS